MQTAAPELPSGDQPQALPIKVKVRDVAMDVKYQARAEMNSKTVRSYEIAYNNKAALPPIEVVINPRKTPGAQKYQVISGWHRLQALNNIGAKDVEVVVVPVPAGASVHRLRWLGGKANLTNGEPLKGKDKRELFRAYIKAGANRTPKGGYKSYREMATDLPLVTHQTIALWMRKDFPAIWKLMGKTDGADNKAQGTGQVLVEMPSLTNQTAELFMADLIEEAKGAGNERRWEIKELLRTTLATLEAEAPSHLPLSVWR